MATQKDLDKLKKQLSDLDAKLKSMRGNQKAPVARPPNFVDMGRDVPRTPIDMVRDPGFGSAMANQNFLNSLAELRAKAAAERGTPTPSVGKRDPRDPNTQYGGPVREPKAPTQPRLSGQDPRDQNTRYKGPEAPTQPRLNGPQVGGDFTQGRLMGAPTEQPNPNAGKPLYFQALEGELQKQFLDKNPQLQPKPGTALNPQLMQENYAKFLQNQMAEVNKFNAANPQYAQDIRQPNPSLARQSEQSFLEGLLDYSKVSPSQVKVLNQLKSSYLNERQGTATQPPIPQNPQMATYNNLLQQGIQRSNTLNQDAASNFANMQAGAPIPQPATPAKANPTMPIAGLGMQQPRATPAPRKFSTVNTPSARFG